MRSVLGIENKHKRDKYVKTHPNYDENHIYLIHSKSHIELGYKSVTRFMEQFFEKFDANATVDRYYSNWQEKKHKKYFDMSKEEIILSWKANGQKARDEGTEMHLAFENYVNEEDIGFFEGEEINNFISWFDTEVGVPFRTEYTVYGAVEKIVGNIDFIYENKDGEMCIVDYKRTAVPTSYSFSNSRNSLGMKDTKLSKHILQLNIYKYLLEKYYDLEIIHVYNLYIRKNKCQFIEQDIIDINYIFDEVVV